MAGARGCRIRVTRAPTLQEHVEDVLAVLDAAKVDTAIVNAASFAGPVGIAFAASHPERATALTLNVTAARFHTGPAQPPLGIHTGGHRPTDRRDRCTLGRGRTHRACKPLDRRTARRTRAIRPFPAFGDEPFDGENAVEGDDGLRRSRHFEFCPMPSPRNGSARRSKRCRSKRQPRWLPTYRRLNSSPCRQAITRLSTLSTSSRGTSLRSAPTRPRLAGSASWRPSCSPTSSVRPSLSAPAGDGHLESRPRRA